MIHIKNAKEIEGMKASAAVLVEVKQILWDAIVPGISLKELDDISEREFAKRGAKPAFKGYGGFPGVACISVNDMLIHGIANDYIVKEGDLVSIDNGCILDGWYSDSCFTKGVGKISKRGQKVIDVAKGAFYAGVDAIKPGARVGDIEAAIGAFVKSKGMYVPDGFTGHGIGRSLHEAPQVHNKGTAGTGPLLKDGMIICIEPMILQGSDHVFHHDDGWGISSANGKLTAHYEHEVLIENGRPVIITEGI